MSLADIYVEMERDFNELVQARLKDAKTILSKYPQHFDDNFLISVIKSIFREQKIHADSALPEEEWKRIINEKTLFHAILSWHIQLLYDHVAPQSRWLDTNDVTSTPVQCNSRREFLVELIQILSQKSEAKSIEEKLTFKFKMAKQLGDKIASTDMAALKDTETLGFIAIISSLLKYCCMLMHLIFPSYKDPVVANKCTLGNSWYTLWSGKSLHTIYLEHAEATLAKIDALRGLIENNVDIEVNEDEVRPLLGAS
ncbi:MAG: hypothetical protein P4L79_14185 [Legionella sp.]|uniref:hypothetical protein n=1 Tax=Legionella sp. TaxID=459 RepID=UPI00284E91B7|nr:hypothetical protein [Legionella sp.]